MATRHSTAAVGRKMSSSGGEWRVAGDKWQAARVKLSGKWLNRSASPADPGLCNYLPDWEGAVRVRSCVATQGGHARRGG